MLNVECFRSAENRKNFLWRSSIQTVCSVHSLRMKRFHFLSAAMAWVLLLAGSAQAQSPPSTPGLTTGLLKLFGDITAFTAKVDVQVLDKTGREALRMPITFTVLDGKIRVDTDFNQVKTPDLSASALAELKRVRMDRVTSLLRPDE